jgi:hypothetical protein
MEVSAGTGFFQIVNGELRPDQMIERLVTVCSAPRLRLLDPAPFSTSTALPGPFGIVERRLAPVSGRQRRLELADFRKEASVGLASMA